MKRLDIRTDGFHLARERASRFHSVERVRMCLDEIFDGKIPIDQADEKIPHLNNGLIWVGALGPGQKLDEIAEQVVVQVRQWEARPSWLRTTIKS